MIPPPCLQVGGTAPSAPTPAPPPMVAKPLKVEISWVVVDVDNATLNHCRPVTKQIVTAMH